MLTISALKIPSPLILAPLAGYSDLPFRRICREFGAGLCFSEMISCHGLAYKQEKTLKMLDTLPDENPVAFQLFGSDISVMANAADLLNQWKPDLVDINMGCPVKKVTKKGAGAALMATPDIAEKIIKEVVKNSESPVTVKIRKGIDEKNINCLDFVKMIEDSGASAVSIHGRTWAQGFSGRSDWDIIAKAKKCVSIPVIGNGDITSFDAANSMLLKSCCDGIMIGRGALGNPWVFSKNGRPRCINEIIPTVLRHLQLMQYHLEVEKVLAMIKNQVGKYFKGVEGGARMRKKIYSTASFQELCCAIEQEREKPF